MTIDLKACMQAVYADRGLHKAAWSHTAGLLMHHVENYDLLRDRKHLGASAMGSCVYERWVSFHLPESVAPIDFDTNLFRFDLGTLAGAHMASLFTVGLPNLYSGYFAVNEVETEYRGIKGHADSVAYDAQQDPLLVIDWKTSYWPKGQEPEPPHVTSVHYVHQVCLNALALGAPLASLGCGAPSLTRSYDKSEQQMQAPNRFKQFDYEPELFRTAVDAEIDRLMPATGETAPTCDVVIPWRARLCCNLLCPQKETE